MAEQGGGHRAHALSLSHAPSLIHPGRTRLYVPVADAAAAAEGKRVAWLVDEHSRRRLIVIEGPGGLPGVDGGGGGDGSAARRRGAPPGLVVEKLAAVLQRALRIDAETARFYVTSARCDVRAAMEKVRASMEGPGQGGAGWPAVARCRAASESTLMLASHPPWPLPPPQYEEDRRWERCMRRRGPRLRLP